MFLRELSPIDKIQLNVLSAHGGGNDGGIGVNDVGFCGATPHFFQSDRWSCAYRNMQMMLGNLFILQNDPRGVEPAIAAVAIAETFQLASERKSERRGLLNEERRLSGARVVPSVRNLQGRFDLLPVLISL